MTLLQSFGDRIRDELVLLAPPGCIIPQSFTRRCVGLSSHARWLSAAQRVRGRIYLADGALRAAQLTADGRHIQRTDHDSWHLLAVNGNGEVQGCARYRHLTGNVGFDDLGVRESWLARCDQWGLRLRSAVESEIARAKQCGTAFSEAGGWALLPEKRCTVEALRIALATYGLAQILGGCVGITTATERHRSASMLRRIGGRSLEYGGADLPSYYDPEYRCRMEVLRFDSSSPNSSFSSMVKHLGKRLAEVSVVVAPIPAESPIPLPARPIPVFWQSSPQFAR